MEAEVIERIFALKITGFGYQTIAKKLNDEGVPTKRGGSWRTNTIKRIIESRRYIAERKYLGEVKPMSIPPLIDRETWDMAQASIRRQVHAPRSTYALSGLLHCGNCRFTLHRVRTWRDGQANGQADWRCPECGKVAIREFIVESAVLEAFFAHLDPARYQERLQEASKEIKRGEGRLSTLRKRLSAVERKQARLLDELGRDDTTLTRETFNKKNRELQGVIDDLASAIQELEDKALLSKRPANLGNICEDWNILDTASRQAALSAFIERVDITSQNGLRGADRISVTFRA